MIMEDFVIERTSSLKAWIARPAAGDARDLTERVVGKAKSAGVEVLVIRGDMIFGEDQIRSALYHAKKSIEEGRNSSSSLSMETLLYASGEKQLSTATKKMNFDESAREAIVAVLTDGPFYAEKSWTPLPKIRTDFDRQNLVRFGLTENELVTVSRSLAMDLVLEKVAAVDILKK